MKREYVKPVAEKMEFNYTETIVASSTCEGEGYSYQRYTDDYAGCIDRRDGSFMMVSEG